MRFAGWIIVMTLSAPAAHAATDTTQFQVTATVVASCDVSANALAFGAYDPVAATPDDAATTISVTCTNGAGYEIGLDEGLGAGAAIAARRMQNGAEILQYGLFTDALRTQIWGETIGVDTVAAQGIGAVQVFTIYGRIPAQQSAPAGAYSDTILVTVTY